MKSKSIVENSFYNIIYKIINMVFPLITTTIISHALLPEGVGKVASAQNFVTYFTLIACMGIPNYGVREIAKSRCKSDTDEIFSELFIINACSTVICTIVYYFTIDFVPFFFEEKKLYMTVGLLIVLNIFNIDWFYQGKEEFRYIAVRSCIVKILLLFLTFLLIKDTNDYVVYALLYCMGMGGNYVLNVLNLRKYNISFKLDKQNLIRHLKPVALLLASNIAVELYSLIDVTMLTVQCTDEIVGYYTNAMKLVKVLTSLIAAIGGVLLPRISLYLREGRNDKVSELVNAVSKVMLYLIIPAVVGIMGISNLLIVVIFGPLFEPATVTLRILSFLLIAVSFSNLFGIQILIAAGDETKVLVATVCGAVSNVIMNVFLITIWQQNGAAIASVVSESIVTLIMYHYSKKYFTFRFEPQFLSSLIIGGGGLVFLLVVFSKMNFENNAITLLFQIGISIIVYVCMSYRGLKCLFNTLRYFTTF